MFYYIKHPKTGGFYARYTMKKSEEQYLEKLGSRIRDLRRGQKFSLRQFGKMVDVNYAYLSGIETGKNNPSILLLKKIADGLGVDIKDLL